MQQPTVDSTSIQNSTDHIEKTEHMPQGGDVALDLSRRLESFRRTHPYKELQVEGRQWRYVVGGQGKRTLLLFPGGTLVPDTYFMLLEDLERSSRVIVPAYAAVPTIAELVTGATAILDAEGIERVDVMGSSFGGYVAQCFVRAHPDRNRSAPLCLKRNITIPAFAVHEVASCWRGAIHDVAVVVNFGHHLT
jgi:hypothetical protein